MTAYLSGTPSGATADNHGLKPAVTLDDALSGIDEVEEAVTWGMRIGEWGIKKGSVVGDAAFGIGVDDRD